MNRSNIHRTFLAGFTALFALGLLALPEALGGVRYLLKVSPNQRRLVDQDNQPVYIHGHTGWSLFRDLSLADAVNDGAAHEGDFSLLEFAPPDQMPRHRQVERDHVVGSPRAAEFVRLCSGRHRNGRFGIDLDGVKRLTATPPSPQRQ